MDVVLVFEVANLLMNTGTLEIGSTAGGAARGLSPPTSSYKGGAKASNAAARNVHQEVTDDNLKSPTMLKTTMDKNAAGKQKMRSNTNKSPS